MYAMSWERNASEYKYESIQDNYSVDFYENDSDEVSLDALIENGLQIEEMEIEGEVF